MSRSIDLNVDVGEGFSDDGPLLGLATSANVCCGEHAGSRELSMRTVDACRLNGIRVGAHPGYPDRVAMGRRSPTDEETPSFLMSIEAQIEWFSELEPCYLKPHGAFYIDTARDAASPAAKLLVRLLGRFKFSLMGLASSAHAEIAAAAGVPLISEGFADRGYEPDGCLIPRDRPGAILTDPMEIQAQVGLLARSVDSLCIHGDTSNCVDFVMRVRKVLVEAGYRIGN